MDRPGERLLDLTFAALEHAVASLAGTDGPLVPFALIESGDGQRTLARFATGATPDEARQHARLHVAKARGCALYAIAADGTVQEQGHRVPVVMVESGERGAGQHGYAFVQRFASSGGCRFAEPIGNPGIIGHPALLTEQ